MAQELPADLYHLLSTELAARGDFDTLFNVIVSSRQLASAGAVNALYRIAHDSPLRSGGSSEALTFAEQDVVCMKWSILWRTIILSSLGKTMYPYCRHLRMLDLRDLAQLLDQMDEPKYRTKVLKHFFSRGLSSFHLVFDKSQKWRAGRLDAKRIIPAIGDQITQVSPLLEALSEPSTIEIFSGLLPTWAPRLEHLQELELWDGKALGDETLRDLLRIHCPRLARLRIYLSTDSESDSHLAALIGSMPENTLTHFENMAMAGIGPSTCLALNRHRGSLCELKLGLDVDGILALRFLQGCSNLKTLGITQLSDTVDLKGTQNDAYLDIVHWLTACSGLKDISLTNIISAPDLALPVLLSKDIHLDSLSIGADRSENTMYAVKDHRDFHQALAEQASLRRLYLRADPDPGNRDDTDTLMNAFCSLEDLRILNLARISDYFTNEHIELLARYLPRLEELYIGGYGISDEILGSVQKLKSLRSLTFSGLTRFTVQGLLDFTSGLGDGNKGLQLTIDMADPDSMLTQANQDAVRDALAIKVEGRFDYGLLRDPNVPEFYQSDSE